MRGRVGSQRCFPDSPPVPSATRVRCWSERPSGPSRRLHAVRRTRSSGSAGGNIPFACPRGPGTASGRCSTKCRTEQRYFPARTEPVLCSNKCRSGSGGRTRPGWVPRLCPLAKQRPAYGHQARCQARARASTAWPPLRKARPGRHVTIPHAGMRPASLDAQWNCQMPKSAWQVGTVTEHNCSAETHGDRWMSELSWDDTDGANLWHHQSASLLEIGVDLLSGVSPFTQSVFVGASTIPVSPLW